MAPRDCASSVEDATLHCHSTSCWQTGKLSAPGHPRGTALLRLVYVRFGGPSDPVSRLILTSCSSRHTRSYLQREWPVHSALIQHGRHLCTSRSPASRRRLGSIVGTFKIHSVMQSLQSRGSAPPPDRGPTLTPWTNRTVCQPEQPTHTPGIMAVDTPQSAPAPAGRARGNAPGSISKVGRP